MAVSLSCRKAAALQQRVRENSTAKCNKEQFKEKGNVKVCIQKCLQSISVRKASESTAKKYRREVRCPEKFTTSQKTELKAVNASILTWEQIWTTTPYRGMQWEGRWCKHRAGIFMPSHLVLPNHPKTFPMRSRIPQMVGLRKKRKRKQFSPSTHQRIGSWVAVDLQMVE